MFRPRLDIDTRKEPKRSKSAERVEKAGCDTVEVAPPAGSVDIKALEEKLAKAEKRLNRARSRLDQIVGDLLLAEDEDEKEDLRAEQKDAQKRMDSAKAEYDDAKQDLDEARARHQEEARVEAEMQAAAEEEERAKREEVLKRAKEKAKATDEPGEAFPPIDIDKLTEEKKDDECVPVETLEDAELGPMPKPKKPFKWTPKKAIAVIFVVGLVLPAVLYSFVIPRADVTVRTWYYEGFLSTNTVDVKVINDGSVEVTNLDINISVMKVVGPYDVYLGQYLDNTPSVGIMSEKNFEGMTFHDDQNEKYVIQVKVSFDAGSKHFSKSYTHHIDGQYMNVFFNDRVNELAF